MDVVCGRCRAEYEFDDALISERGTTVRCTNCGLQFEVFPAVGVRAVELWRVYRKHRLDSPVLEYDTLETLQRGISTAEVRSSDWLARGDASPRPLAEIVELLPLLAQRTSVGPPSLGANANEAVQAGVRLGSSGTVIGIAMASELEGPLSAEPPPLPVFPPSETNDPGDEAVVHELRSDTNNAQVEPWVEELEDDPEALVPVASDLDPPFVETSEPSNSSSGKLATKQRVRSALSQTTGASSELTNASPIALRASRLNRTFIGAAPHAGESEAPPSSNKSNYPAPSSPGQAPFSSPEAPATSDAIESNRPSSMPPSTDRRTSPLPEANSVVEPTFFSRSDGPEPATEVEAPRAATTIALWLFMATCGGLFVWSQMGNDPPAVAIDAIEEKTAQIAAPAPVANLESIQKPALTEGQIADKITRFELSWWDRLLAEGSPVALSDRELSLLVEEQDSKPSWRRVNLLRLVGRIQEARRIAVLLPIGDDVYAPVMLSFAEGAEAPAADLMEKLKSSLAQDQAPYFRRAAFIYAQGRSNNLALARTEYNNLGKMTDRSQTTLYRELGTWLSATEAQALVSASEPTDASEKREAVTMDHKQSAQAIEPAKRPEKKPGDQEVRAADTAPSAPQVSGVIQAKVDQADTLWRGGRREQAVVIYRQVVAEIGTSHFLGQRSAARVLQAEREQSSAP